MEEVVTCEKCLFYNTDVFVCQCKNSPYYGQEMRCDSVCEEAEI